VGAAGLGAAVAAIAGAFACRQAIGIDQYFNANATTTVCGLPCGTTTCASCVNTSCCSESTTCAADPVCSAYEGCLGKCNGDMKCRSQCAIAHPTGTASEVTALSVCLARSCETECGLTCGTLAGWQVEPDAGTSCGACYATQACSVGRACAKSTNCDSLNRCTATCVTPDCTETCGIDHGNPPNFGNPADAGVADSAEQAFTGLYQGACATACASGAYWECLGAVSWPSPRSTTVTAHFSPKDFSSGSVVPGATVSVCNATDLDCMSPLQTGVVPSDGVITLSFLNRPDNQLGQILGLDGYFKVIASNYVPSYYYWGFPLSEPDFFAYTDLVTPSALQQFATAQGVSIDPARGELTVAVYDCLTTPGAAGVEVTLDTADNETQSVSLSSGVATRVTDSPSGTLFFWNVKPGVVNVTTTPVAIGRRSGKCSPTIRAGASTVLLAYPTPNP
jgi:hypothetical protein